MKLRFGSFVLAGLLVATAGCGGRELVRVSGKVTVDGAPLSTGRISFIPDAAKGNKAPVACVGQIGANGQFDLFTTGVQGSDNGKGAPAGWYKVILMNKFNSTELDDKVDPIYFNEATTPLSIEVTSKPPPGSYEIKVAKTP
jgi:hypothetical protein